MSFSLKIPGSSFFKHLYIEHKRLTKPTIKQLLLGTISSVCGAVLFAVCVSGIDAACTFLLGLILR